MNLFEINTEYAPIRLMIQVGRPSDASLRAFLDAERKVFEALRRRGERVVLVLDGSCGRDMDWALHETRALWVACHRELLEQTVIGVAVLAKRDTDALSARDWFASLQVPHFADDELEAVLGRVFEWVEDEDEDLGAPLVFQGDALLRSLGCAA